MLLSGMGLALEIALRPLALQDRDQWELLWKAYCSFYRESLPESTTETTWNRLVDPASPIKGWGAFSGPIGGSETLIGFAHTVLHLHTWSPKFLCYLEDLFVAEEARGRDVGYRLIEHLRSVADEHGWGRVYWHTETSNTRARRLYDRFHPADEYVRYTLST